MNRFSEEIRIISPVAWALALLGAAAMFFWLYFVGIPRNHELRYWSLIGKVSFSLCLSVVIFLWVLLIGYINADARRRGMRYIMWTLLAIFVPNSIGIILYFVLRDPLMVRCAQCGTEGRVGFVFCPQCGNALSPVCPGCRRSVEPAWKKCAFCGLDLHPITPVLKTTI